LRAHSFTDEQIKPIMEETREEYRRLIPEKPEIAVTESIAHSTC